MSSGIPPHIWLHRISHHAEASQPLLDSGLLTIGFSGFCDQEFLERTRDGKWEYFVNAFAQRWPDNPQARSRHSLWRFVARMQVADWVVVPSWGTFSLFRIESDANLIGAMDLPDLSTWDKRPLSIRHQRIYAGETQLDLGFFRRVGPIATGISRYDFADAALTSRMKYRATTLDITDLSASLEKALTAFRNNRPINLHAQVLAGSAESLLKLIQHELVPDKFEALIAWYFRRVGATDVTIPAKNDPGKEGDADIIAVFEPLKTIYYVQAKHHIGQTAEWAAEQIKEFKGNKDGLDDGYSKIAWVVSSAGTFSAECYEVAKQYSIALFSGPDLARMMLEAGILKLDGAF